MKNLDDVDDVDDVEEKIDDDREDDDDGEASEMSESVSEEERETGVLGAGPDEGAKDIEDLGAVEVMRPDEGGELVAKGTFAVGKVEGGGTFLADSACRRLGKGATFRGRVGAFGSSTASDAAGDGTGK